MSIETIVILAECIETKTAAHAAINFIAALVWC